MQLCGENGGNLHELYTLPYLKLVYGYHCYFAPGHSAIKPTAFAFLKRFAHKLELSQQISPGRYKILCKCPMTVDDKDKTCVPIICMTAKQHAIKMKDEQNFDSVSLCLNVTYPYSMRSVLGLQTLATTSNFLLNVWPHV